jgi:Yip1 domain
MAADENSKRFSIDDARARAQEAMRKSEFILSRAWGLFSEPKKEWAQIRAEETTIPNILIGYAAPLAAIPPVCDLIGQALFAGMLQGEPAQALIRAFVYWLVSLGLVAFLGILISLVADTFDADRDDLAAQKIAAYSMTPAFLSGIFSLWPPLWWLSMLALGAMVFIMYRGLPILMKAPEERALAYAATVTVSAVVAFVLMFALAGCVT